MQDVRAVGVSERDVVCNVGLAKSIIWIRKKDVRWGAVCGFDCQVLLFFRTGRGSECAAALGVG